MLGDTRPWFDATQALETTIQTTRRVLDGSRSQKRVKSAQAKKRVAARPGVAFFGKMIESISVDKNKPARVIFLAVHRSLRDSFPRTGLTPGKVWHLTNVGIENRQTSEFYITTL
jgi:hypothetical protein